MADEAFITAVPLTATSLKSKKKNKRATDILEHVRHDHSRIMHVVKEFGAKVSTMVDKQRAEYIQAYESHMQDVQKELFLLREKVHILDTDETRAMKMKQLQDEQDRLKAESVHLDEQNDVMRQKLRALTISMQSVERDRDWLLGRLQKAKKTYTRLERRFAAEKTRLGVDQMEGSGMLSLEAATSLSQESSLFFDMYKMKKLHGPGGGHASTRTGTGTGAGTGAAAGTGRGAATASHRDGWRQRFVAEIAVSRSNPLLPMAAQTNPNASSRAKLQASASAPTLRRAPAGTATGAGAATGGTERRTGGQKSRLERSAVALLVAMRARQEAMREVVDRCFKTCDRGAALLTGNDASVEIAPLPDLVVASMETIVANRDAAPDDEAAADARREYIMQLIYHPELYLAIADVISGKYGQPARVEAGDGDGGDGGGGAGDHGPAGVDLTGILALDFGGGAEAGEGAGEGGGEEGGMEEGLSEGWEGDGGEGEATERADPGSAEP